MRLPRSPRFPRCSPQFPLPGGPLRRDPKRLLRASLLLGGALTLLVALSTALRAVAATPANLPHFDGQKAYDYARELIACGPRYNGSEGLVCAQGFIKKQFPHDNLEDDAFTANTPAGPQRMHNLIVRFPGKKDGIILLATHYETNYPLRNTSFIGANDGASTTGLLIEIGNDLRERLRQDGGKLDGYSVWLLFDDGEEAVQQWSDSDSLYGTRHIAAKWASDGTLKRIRALLVADMIGDKDLDVQRDQNSTPWLLDVVDEAAKKCGYGKYFFQSTTTVEDDHLPFVRRGVPSADVIDLDYGPHDFAHPDGWHHTTQDTLDKISARSLTIDGDVFLETIRLLNAR
jgi:glutaminyl-peptide cyclotransferase